MMPPVGPGFGFGAWLPSCTTTHVILPMPSQAASMPAPSMGGAPGGYGGGAGKVVVVAVAAATASGR
jgi:hypothetical protein